MEYRITNEKEKISEPCGRVFEVEQGWVVHYHSSSYQERIIETPHGVFKRTYCPTCMTYWEEKYKKIGGIGSKKKGGRC